MCMCVGDQPRRHWHHSTVLRFKVSEGFNGTTSTEIFSDPVGFQSDSFGSKKTGEKCLTVILFSVTVDEICQCGDELVEVWRSVKSSRGD